MSIQSFDSKMKTKSQLERQRVHRRFAELKNKYGNRCYFCGQTWLLEFAHVKPTKLSGRSRGLISRYIDIKNNPDCYLLTCKNHNSLAQE